MKRDNSIYLHHIIDHLSNVTKYLEGFTYSTFLESQLHQDAVIRNLEVCGEGTKKVTADIKDNYPVISWRAIAGMRDKLIHDYFNVDLEIVWETAKSDVPTLVKTIQKILDDLNYNSPA